MARYTLPFLGTERPVPGSTELYSTSNENQSWDAADAAFRDHENRIDPLEAWRTTTQDRLDKEFIPNIASDAERLAKYPTPKLGDKCFRTDRRWTEEYFTDVHVTVAGWYPVSGKLPRIDLGHNGTLVTFGGGAWTPIRDTWNWAAPRSLNAAGVLAWETGMFKTLIPGFYEFSYNMDLNIGSGALILAISAFTGSHAFADDRALASQTYPRAAGRAGGKITTGEILMDKDKFVQGNVFPDVNGTLDGARKTTNFISARYVGPPFKP